MVWRHRLRKPGAVAPRTFVWAGRSEQRRLRGRRRTQAEVRERRRGRGAPAGGALDQPLLEQVGLIDVLDRVLLLPHRDRERRETDRPAVELRADRAEDLAVEAIEAELVD